MSKGIEAAWQRLAALEPRTVEQNSLARHEDGAYLVESLGMRFRLDPATRSIEGLGDEASRMIEAQAEFVGLSLVWYLAGAMDIPESGRLMKPESLKGGHHFFKTTHALPLSPIASMYDADPEGFIRRGIALGGRPVSGLGDASVELRPLPRIPVTMILWRGDEEFPPRADLLFDSSCEFHLALDILWAAAMLCCLAMR